MLTPHRSIRVRELSITMAVGALSGIVAAGLLSLYVELDLVRQVPFLAKPDRLTMTSADVVQLTGMFIFYGVFTLGIPLEYLRTRRWLALLMYLLCPWSVFCLGVVFLTPPDGFPYRGFINALAYLSIAVAQELLAVAMLYLLRWRNVID